MTSTTQFVTTQDDWLSTKSKYKNQITTISQVSPEFSRRTQIKNGKNNTNTLMIDKSITVKLTDGSSKIVLLSQNTVISKTGNATKDDLKTGTQVMIFGTDNSDGSLTGQNIQLK